MKQLSKSEISVLNEKINTQFNRLNFFNKKDKIVSLKAADKVLIVKDKSPLFFYEKEQLVPTLKLLLQQPLLKKITVDRGAVKFVTNGADIMRPGITKIDDNIKKEEFVVVVDETHEKPLAICQTLFDGEEIKSIKSGKVLKNLHHITDKLWKIKI